MICAGTNDCTREINIDATAEHFSELLQVATEKTASVGNVTVSSIPPRTDNVGGQQRVEELNTVPQDMTTKAGANFVSNDKSFRLTNGQPNDGYLHNDGVHLINRGTARMIRNLGLVRRSACECTSGSQLAAADDKKKPLTGRRCDQRQLAPNHNENYNPYITHDKRDTLKRHSGNMRRRRRPGRRWRVNRTVSASTMTVATHGDSRSTKRTTRHTTTALNRHIRLVTAALAAC